MRQGDTITLEPKTRHGKNRINEHGADWIVMNTGRFKVGQAWTFDGRWVLINNDPDFDIIAN